MGLTLLLMGMIRQIRFYGAHAVKAVAPVHLAVLLAVLVVVVVLVVAASRRK
jgi:hypothetical protein